jgi:murein DD-endopeptidase MepM/ murein hydrolase activator NlpD
MKFFIFVILFSLSVHAQIKCDYKNNRKCPSGLTCVRVDSEKSECRDFDEFVPTVGYPFPEKRGILCDQGVESPHGNSHSFLNTIYAIDLKTPKGTDPEGIKAGVSGVTFVESYCKTHNDKCGQGFGNYVRIMADNGVIVQYAHLEKVWIPHKQRVNAGAYIGLEGMTGWTGANNRHLHFSVHFEPGFTKERFFKGELPKSIPFKMNICQNAYGTCNGQVTDIRNLKCARITHQLEWVSTFKL